MPSPHFGLWGGTVREGASQAEYMGQDAMARDRMAEGEQRFARAALGIPIISKRCRKLPEPGVPFLLGLLFQIAAPLPVEDPDPEVDPGRWRWGCDSRVSGGISLTPSDADIRQGARVTMRCAGRADQCSKFHQGLVEVGAVALPVGRQCSGGLNQLFGEPP